MAIDLNSMEIHDCPELMDAIRLIGLVPLLDSGIPGFSADELVAPECRYVVTDDGWDWPLWNWKGPMVTEGGFAYGKFFNGKAGFVTMDWWPDLCNYRRARHPEPDAESVEGTILEILRVNESMITRDLRAACGFDGSRMRSRFDAYVTRLQMACRVVTEDFVYPTDKHGRCYGWGWALLTTPEHLFGREACAAPAAVPGDGSVPGGGVRSPEESYARLSAHLRSLLPQASERQITRLLG